LLQKRGEQGGDRNKKTQELEIVSERKNAHFGKKRREVEAREDENLGKEREPSITKSNKDNRARGGSAEQKKNTNNQKEKRRTEKKLGRKTLGGMKTAGMSRA